MANISENYKLTIMKELSVEEKAKAYDNVREKIAIRFGSNVADEIFSQFEMSEDERIRRRIIHALHGDVLEMSEIKEAVSWLEKQGEQKPTDNVEPKFKVGDWITNCACTIQITSIDNRYYWHDNNHVGGDIESIDKQYHLWTIQDAKEGDVLAEDPIFECPSSFVAIYKKQNEEDFDSYCFVGFNGKFYEGECGHSTEYIHPATKEQRDLLFKKMHEAGYEWDADKKELRKIEDEEYNGEDYGIDSLYHAQRILEKTLGKVDGYQTDDGILSHKCAITAVKKLYEQKPAWSEEDEDAIGMAIIALEDMYDEDAPNTTYGGYNLPFNKAAERLKSLKDRNLWKPSDEQMKQLGWIAEQNKDNMIGKELISLYQDLKKLSEE